MHLTQYRVTTVKIITSHWLFILQSIEAIQFVKHPVQAVSLECGWLRRIFFLITSRLGTFSFFWRYVWMLNFFSFFSTQQNFVFYIFGQIFFATWFMYEFSILDKFLKENHILDLNLNRLMIGNIRYLFSIIFFPRMKNRW